MIPTSTLIPATLIILWAVAVLSARLDAGVWKRKGITKAGHLKRAIGRGLFMGVQAWAVFPGLSLSFPWFSSEFILFWLVQACSWWLVFDALINIFKNSLEPDYNKHVALFYVGRTARIDRLFWKLAGKDPKRAAVYSLVTKVVLLTLFVILLEIKV